MGRVTRHAFQTLTITRKLSVLDVLPEKGDVGINVNLEAPPTFNTVDGRDVAVVKSTINITLGGIGEAMMRGETIYELDDQTEKESIEKHLADTKKYPEKLEKLLLNYLGPTAILMLVKASTELGIPPPVPLPHF